MAAPPSSDPPRGSRSPREIAEKKTGLILLGIIALGFVIGLLVLVLCIRLDWD